MKPSQRLKPILCMVFAFIGFACVAFPSVQAQDATLFQAPTINRTHVVFSYAGDLWSAPRTGGDAKRLTNGVGKCTWGGLVASQALPQLMDGGFVTSPDAAIYGLGSPREVSNAIAACNLDVESEFYQEYLANLAAVRQQQYEEAMTLSEGR